MASGEGIPASQIDSMALAAAVLAAALALMLAPGPFLWLASVGGLILLCALFAYDQDGYRSIFQSLVFAAVCGFCLMVASAIFFKLRAGGEITAADPQIAGKWLPLTWAFGTVLFWAIDRARMSGREVVGQQPSARAAMQRTFIPQGTIPQAAQPPYAPASYAPAYPQPVYAPPPPPPTPSPAPVEPAREETVREQPAAAPVRAEATFTQGFARPAPVPIIPVGGKETMIYIALVGEGLNVLRSVRAEHLGRDFYKIVEPTPEGESWEYQQGQVVRCKKKNLSTGKGLVAVEEAPRAS